MEIKLKKRYKYAGDIFEALTAKAEFPIDVAACFLEGIKDADVAPIVHGEWYRELIRNEKGGCVGAKMICSCCRQDNKHDERMSYCPNCGACMDGGKHNV